MKTTIKNLKAIVAMVVLMSVISLVAGGCKKEENRNHIIKCEANGVNAKAYIDNDEIEVGREYMAEKGQFIRVTCGDTSMISTLKIVVSNVVVEQHESKSTVTIIHRVE